MAIFNEEYTEYLLESDDIKKDVSKIESYATRFYKHCLKWLYQPEHQNHSWYESILESSKAIFNICYDAKKKKFNTNKIREGNIKLYDAYKKSIAPASKEIKKEIIDKDYVYNVFPSIELMSNINFVKTWMINFAKDDDMVDRITNYI